MTNNDRNEYQSRTIYTDYDADVCPVCGHRIKHPYIGHVTLEQIEEDSNTCIWEEVVDEGDGTIGFTPICRNIHPYTLESENNDYIHYDFVELLNSWDMSLSEKVEKAISYVVAVFKDKGVVTEDVQIETQGDKITKVAVNKPIKNFVIDVCIDEDGQISLKAG